MKLATEGFLVTLDNGQRFPCRDATEVMDMITAFILIEKLKKKDDFARMGAADETERR